jgi:nucleoid DNA-binding protein
MKDLVKSLAEKTGLSQVQVRDLLQQFLDGITDTLVSQGEIRLGHLGTFAVKMRRERTGRNPRTGEKITIPPRAALTFRPGLEVRERLAKLTQQPQQPQHPGGAPAP